MPITVRQCHRHGKVRPTQDSDTTRNRCEDDYQGNGGVGKRFSRCWGSEESRREPKLPTRTAGAPGAPAPQDARRSDAAAETSFTIAAIPDPQCHLDWEQQKANGVKFGAADQFSN